MLLVILFTASVTPKSTQSVRQKKPLPPLPEAEFPDTLSTLQPATRAQSVPSLNATPKSALSETGKDVSAKKGKRSRDYDSPDGSATKKKRVSSPNGKPVNAVGPQKKVKIIK